MNAETEMLMSSAAEVGHRSIGGMLLLAAALQSASLPPIITVAVTLSSASLIAVGTLIFKAGEWRGEHRALQKEVTQGFADLRQHADAQFQQLREDIREIRHEDIREIRHS